MSDLLNSLAFDPYIPDWAMIGFAVVLFIASFMIAVSDLKSYFWRLLAGLFLLLAISNPQKVDEDRTPLKDTVIILNDVSQSMDVGKRESTRRAILGGLEDGFENDETLDDCRRGRSHGRSSS